MGRRRDRFAWSALALGLAASSAGACSFVYDPDSLHSGAQAASGRGGASVAGAAGGGGRGGTAAAGGGQGGTGTAGAGRGGSSGKGGSGATAGTPVQGGGAGGDDGGVGGAATTSARAIYWVEQGSDSLNRANPDGSGAERLADTGSGSYLRAVALDSEGGKLYFTDSQRSRVQRANLDGTDVETISPIGDEPVGLDLDLEARKVYVVDQGGIPLVARAGLDGNDWELIITSGLDEPYGIALDPEGSRLFLTDAGRNAILRADLDGRNLGELDIPEVTQPADLALDLARGKLYWSELGPPPRLRRANVDGSSPEDVLTTASMPALIQPLGVEIDTAGGALYFVDGSSGAIRRSSLDGSGIVSLLEELDGPVGLALAY